MTEVKIVLIVPPQLVQMFRERIEDPGDYGVRLWKDRKINKVKSLEDLRDFEVDESDKERTVGQYMIPSFFQSADEHEELSGKICSHTTKISICERLNVINYADDLILGAYKAPSNVSDCYAVPSDLSFPKRQSRLANVVQQWLIDLPSADRESIPRDISDSTFAYTIYKPLLLLPSNAAWSSLLANVDQTCLEDLYAAICRKFRVTHIALNNPIPVMLPNVDCEGQDSPSVIPNVLRSPTKLFTLYGDFGAPLLPANQKPNSVDFDRAFWCSTVQNGFRQEWSPQYTMFSRGNISEKTRILGFQGLREKEVFASVDLYAGIGYFAYSYRSAGSQPVLCWEISRWSVEGFRRSSSANGCSILIIDYEQDSYVLEKRTHVDHPVFVRRELRPDEIKETIEKEHLGFVVFCETNKRAPERVRGIREMIPPVRHVNCGYLPTSKESWETAVAILDSDEGGWIHAHENIAEGDIDIRTEEVKQIFLELVQKKCGNLAWGTIDRSRPWVKCDNVHRVKSYAPGIIHCVLDIFIDFAQPTIVRELVSSKE